MSQDKQTTIQANESRYLREQEFSNRYNLSLPFLRNARWKGNGPRFIKINSMVLYDTVDADAWFESKKVASTTEATARRVKP